MFFGAAGLSGGAACRALDSSKTTAAAEHAELTEDRGNTFVMFPRIPAGFRVFRGCFLTMIPLSSTCTPFKHYLYRQHRYWRGRAETGRFRLARIPNSSSLTSHS
jgi:hypothetical protein